MGGGGGIPISPRSGIINWYTPVEITVKKEIRVDPVNWF